MPEDLRTEAERTADEEAAKSREERGVTESEDEASLEAELVFVDVEVPVEADPTPSKPVGVPGNRTFRQIRQDKQRNKS